MKDAPIHHETLAQHEQAILDTALLESDQLLARSLHDDQRRRRTRSLILGGVAMGLLYLAFQLGWLSVTGPVTTEGNLDTLAIESITQEEDTAWKKRLLSVTNRDPWHVGANIGTDLVRIHGDYPYQLLKTHWKTIAVEARKQILKGFTPGMPRTKEMQRHFLLHSHFFDVMHLGMSDSNAEVRSFAAHYLTMQGLPDFEQDLAGYQRWRTKNKNLSANAILRLAKSEDGPPQR